MKRQRPLPRGRLAAVAAGVTIAMTTALAVAPPASAARPVGCADLGSYGHVHSAVSASAEVVPASAGLPAYCQVTLVEKPAITIRVNLPVNTVDGGRSGSVQGAWNGAIVNEGGGGYAGQLSNPVLGLSRGYVGSSTDTGHSAAWCNATNPRTGEPNSQPNCGLAGGGFVLDAEDNLVSSRVEDFIEDSLYLQTRWALDLTRVYYGRAAVRNYWYGASTGGRQGWEMAQTHGNLFDGFVVGQPAMNWNRFIIGEAWPAVVTSALLGTAGLTPTKSAAANAAAVTACDGADGVLDRTIDDPLSCTFDAQQLRCDQSTVSTCLTEAEARAVNLIWDGPRDSRGGRLWGGLMRGTSFDTLLPGGNTMSSMIETYVANWLNEDPGYDWRSDLTIDRFTAAFRASFEKFEDVASTDSTDLSKVLRSGAKIIFWHGLSDALITPFGSYNYSQRLDDRYGAENVRSFVRTFFFPGVGHTTPSLAGRGSAAGHLLDALEQWVDSGIAPDKFTQTYGAGRTRTVCAYPGRVTADGGCAPGVVAPERATSVRTVYDPSPGKR